MVLILFALALNGICQNSEKKNLPIKPYYAIEANFGISAMNKREFVSERVFESKFSYQTLVYGVNFVGGIELTHYFKVGLGIGYFYYKQQDQRTPYSVIHLPNSMTTHGIPLFVYLRSDFLDRKISPYMDIKIGNNFLITKETIDYGVFNHPVLPFIENFGTFKLKNGLFLASKIGVAFKTNSKATINVSVGYQYVSRTYDMPYGGATPIIPNDKIKYAKTGNITVDHQFLLGVGVSF